MSFSPLNEILAGGKFKYFSYGLTTVAVVLLILSSISYFSIRSLKFEDETTATSAKRSSLGLFVLSLLLSSATGLLVFYPKLVGAPSVSSLIM